MPTLLSDQLAADAVIPRASLNTRFEKLETSGLIRRHRRVDEVTRNQKSTRYVLGFEDDFGGELCPDSGHGNGQKPCPDFGKSHVQHLDTNLVREPATTTAHDAGASGDAEAACLAACGEGLTPAAKAAITTTRPVIDAWLAVGYDLATDILPAITERTKRKRAEPIRTWAYFTTAIAKRHAQRTALAAKPKSAGEPEQVATLTAYDILLRTAEWINSGRYVPPSAVSTHEARGSACGGTGDRGHAARQADLLNTTEAQT